VNEPPASPPAPAIAPKPPFPGALVEYVLPDGQVRAAFVVRLGPLPDGACKLKVLLDESEDLGKGAHALQGVPATRDPTSGREVVWGSGFCPSAAYNAAGAKGTWHWPKAGA
jgi:hypothetical protein